jgi:protein TonB
MTAVLLAVVLTGPAFAIPDPQTPQTVRVGGDVKPPQKTKDAKPVYPPLAAKNHMQGVVILEVTIGTDGKVKDVKVIKGLAYVTDSAVDAVKQWEYKPTVLNGQPVQVIVTVPINFVLQ